jgi:hypothetical protein
MDSSDYCQYLRYYPKNYFGEIADLTNSKFWLVALLAESTSA